MSCVLMAFCVAVFAGCARTTKGADAPLGQAEAGSKEDAGEDSIDSLRGKADKEDEQDRTGESRDEDVTAEELLEHAFGDQKIESVDMDYLRSIDCEADMSEAMGGNTSGTMNASYRMELNIKITPTHSSCLGVNEVSILGMNVSAETRAYEAVEDGVSTFYVYDSDSDTWTVETNEDMEGEDRIGVESLLDTDNFEDYWLAAGEADVYVVEARGEIPGFSSMLTQMEDEQFRDMLFDVRITFDRETKLVKTLEYTLGQEGIMVDGIQVKQMNYQYTFHQFNGVEVQIPQEVIGSAM